MLMLPGAWMGFINQQGDHSPGNRGGGGQGGKFLIKSQVKVMTINEKLSGKNKIVLKLF